MNYGLFESFCELLETLPAGEILKTTAAERQRLEDDLARKRVVCRAEARSVASFCEFVAAAVSGAHYSCPDLPVEHCAYYRKVVQRLVEAAELPASARNDFEVNFSQALFKALMSPV
jgi:hypothetical protein